jgi:hypothetical protein
MNKPIADPYSMNKRMQHLYNIVVEDAGYTETTGNYISEKFAKLIVKECAQLAKDSQDWYATNTHSGLVNTDISAKIKEHFGVEE